MLFNSIPFLLFYILVLVLFYKLSHFQRWVMLIFAGAFFYMYFIPSYIIILLILIFIDFNVARQIPVSRHKKLLLFFSISSNLGLLLVFKYLNFLNSNIGELAKLVGWNYGIETFSLILPLGLSFHTFQSISYVVDVYRKKWKPEKNLLKYSLFVLFFPQLVAGPIERASQLMPQLFVKIEASTENLKIGFQRILFGLFKKIVIADHLAIIVDSVYKSPDQFIGFPLVLATAAFAIQIYCDFSGYSDIAIGLARTFGIKLEENFNSPYLSTSISMFWRRWHISLYKWFQDYIYIPLGGSRVGKLKHSFNILIVFLISGLWHGASWTYIVWGLLHGIFLIGESILNKIKTPLTHLPKVIKIFSIFLLVSFAWIFFRANNLADAFYIVNNFYLGYGALLRQILMGDLYAANSYLFLQNGGLNMSGIEVAIILTSIVSLFIFEIINEKKSFFEFPKSIRWIINILICLTIINFSVGQNLPFVYFQF